MSTASAARLPPLPTLEVSTAFGRLRGRASEGCTEFLGVPFAKPPMGPLRFQPPQPLEPWIGLRDATRSAPAAMQPGGKTFSQSEDCLYLNLWVPEGPGPYPVLVWVHGGGYITGRAFDVQQDGSTFARAGVLCITVAYRLGVFGFLDVEPLLGKEYAGSANNGLRDVMAALQWVKSNIHCFGGDPELVTLAGQSAGAKLVDTLLGVPAAQPLFEQLISESGGAERVASRESAQEVSRGFGFTWTHEVHRPVADLSSALASDLIEIQSRFLKAWPRHFPFRPEIDGDLLPRLPLAVIRSGNTRGKRLLIGTNRDESAFFIGPHPGKTLGANELSSLSLQEFQLLDDEYRKLYPELTPDLRRIRSVSAEEYWIPSLRVLEAHVSNQGIGYMYRLDFPGSDRFQGLAFHSLDLRFVWDRFLQGEPSVEQQNLANAMHAAWATFLKGKQPLGPGLPNWPLYNLSDRSTMIFDKVCYVERDPNRSERLLWRGQFNDVGTTL